MVVIVRCILEPKLILMQHEGGERLVEMYTVHTPLQSAHAVANKHFTHFTAATCIVFHLKTAWETLPNCYTAILQLTIT